MNSYVPYVPTDWEEEPSEETPLDEDAFEKIEQGIVNLEAHVVFYEEIGTIDEITGEVTLNSRGLELYPLQGPGNSRSQPSNQEETEDDIFENQR